MTMHPDQHALWQAILEQPRNDTLRLIYADCLEEQNQAEQAEFVRVQLQLEQWYREQGLRWNIVPGPPTLVMRERKLLNRHGQDWWLPIRKRIGQRKVLPTSFRRGFVSHVSLTVHEVLTHWNDLAAISPIDSLSLNLNDLPRTAAMLEMPLLGRLRQLSMMDRHLEGCQALVPMLAGATHLANIESLAFGISDRWIDTIGVLASMPCWPRLQYLGIHTFHLDSLLLRNLMEVPPSPTLHSLSLTYNLIAAGGVEFLSRSRAYRSQLQSLELAHNPLRDEAIPLLVREPWPQLVRLNLQRTSLTSESVPWLGDATRFPKLRWLNLSMNPLGDEGLEHLLASSLLPQLHGLDVSATNLSAAAIIRLVESPEVANLLDLDLGQNAQTPEVIEAVIRSPQLSGLQTIGFVPLRGAAQAAMHRRFGTGVRV